jgi:hypothetical protein
MEMRWAGHVERKRCEIFTKFRLQSLKKRDDLEDLGIEERILSKWIEWKWKKNNGRGWIGLRLRTWTGGGLL